MNRDHIDILSAFSAGGVEYLVVGAHALAAHGRPRATGDLDLWVNPTPGNAAKVWRALAQFGAPLGQLTVEDLVSIDVVYQIGLPPRRIDVLTSIDGVEFGEAWRDRLTVELGAVEVPVISREHLIRNKRAVGRPQDVADVAWLESDGTDS
ncbi:hypothetical protein [Engelhardtia mirabilis]|uniref:Nucleotidyltransferase n=1 Tax=Engelhardtia mirabilis TaxID=2528011 RepID=A0A518BE80_9BACT|nr:hypothetical protein Pla133_03600 [Planctomycetes bacterium Pla133]QDU99621.1 hypothetical protein Pla86_03600 [Planctomycetes bacterium Pla86]